MGSPRPVMPAFVWTLRNNQRGWTRNVSSLVIFRPSRPGTGAFRSSGAARAERPAAAVAAMTSRRFSMIGSPRTYSKREASSETGLCSMALNPSTQAEYRKPAELPVSALIRIANGQNVRLKGWVAWVAGALSGALGGLVGNEGG